MTFQIRLAGGDDAAEIARLLGDYLPETYRVEWGGSHERLVHDIERGRVRIAVAEKGRALVGLLAYVDTYDLHWCMQGAEVIDFYVIPGQRGLGAAVHLLAWVAKEASCRGASFLKGGAVENPVIRRLYEKVALLQSGGEAHLSGRAFRQMASLSGKPLREMVKGLPRPEWGREP